LTKLPESLIFALHLNVLLTKNGLNMNKADLVAAVAAKAKLTKVDSKKAVDAAITVISGSLKKGDRVALVGFGTFSVYKRAARTGRNPQTGKAIKIAAKKAVKFKAGADLVKAVK
jgi:DNA-binding protein HU-beta